MPVLRVALDLPLHRLFDYVAASSASSADIGLPGSGTVWKAQ